MPGVVNPLGVEQAVEAVQRRQPFDGEFIEQRSGQHEVVFLEREIAEQFEGLALFVGGHRLEWQSSIRVAHVIAMMINATNEFRGGEQSAIVFAQPAAQRATKDLIAFAWFEQFGFHRIPKLVGDFKTLPKVGQRIGRGVELIDQWINGVGGESAERVLIRGVRQHRIGCARSDFCQLRLFVARDRPVGVFNGPIVVRPECDRNKIALLLAFAGDDDRVVIHYRSGLADRLGFGNVVQFLRLQDGAGPEIVPQTERVPDFVRCDFYDELAHQFLFHGLRPCATRLQHADAKRGLLREAVGVIAIAAAVMGPPGGQRKLRPLRWWIHGRDELISDSPH